MVSLGHVHRRQSGASNRSSVDESKISDPRMRLRSLSRIREMFSPTSSHNFPRSMLERITNFMAHPETLLPMTEIDDPVQRFTSVVKFYLSGWHIKPPGVKKPLNPILGEIYTCYWQFPDNTKGYYVSEQTSHHPPKSSYFYMAPEHNIRIDGCLKPRSKFLGNSAASMMEGIAILRFLNRGAGPNGERYILTQPNMYARGILFRQNETGEVLYELSGMWSGEMFIKNVKTGKKDLLFDATRARPSPPLVRPLEEQEDRESQKLWLKTAKAVKERNHEVATDEKTFIEDMQRDEAAKRAEDGVEWTPRLFRPVRGGPGGSEEGEEDLDWILNANIDGDSPQKQTEQILAVYPILPGQPSTSISASGNSGSITPQEKDKENLIDFSNDSPVPAQYQIPADLHAAQTQNNGQQQKDLERTLQSTSTVQGQTQGSLIDFHDDLKKDLPAATDTQGTATSTLYRQDTDTHSLDEFVDAEG
ncbi:hypothetical protein DID88_004956 [Monilinia fructigena]|uniref:Oxysterol-binding protein n=1 Tax=Monilinia fructigena TaxID=38457 RepID=A0A395IQ23_9HELO|nr:hypothetical protein DID88_004956 [Monilinia fructigena]